MIYIVDSMVSQTSTTNWDSSVQTTKTVGDISHLNHNTASALIVPVMSFILSFVYIVQLHLNNYHIIHIIIKLYTLCLVFSDEL